MDVDVAWVNFHTTPEWDRVAARGFWDQTLIERLLADPWPTVAFQEYEGDAESDVAVVVTPGHDYPVATLERFLDQWDAVLLIVTSDEEQRFPWWQIIHPNLAVWKLTHNPDQVHRPDRAIPLGPTPHTQWQPVERDLVWSFAGQVTHTRRQLLGQQLARRQRQRADGEYHPSEGFTQGLAPVEYMRLLSRSMVVPCPSGPQTPDTFRLWETIETGGIPLADAVSPRGGRGYWMQLSPDDPPPFPIVDNWLEVDHAIDRAIIFRRQLQSQVPAWWTRLYQRLRFDLATTLHTLAGVHPHDSDATALITTSPVTSHPSTEHIEGVVESIRARMPHVPIVIAADGVRPEQLELTPDYHEYLRRVTWKAMHQWAGVAVFIASDWGHQANTVRQALNHIHTPLVWMFEHDTPLEGDPIPHILLAELVARYPIDQIRLHHETRIPHEHEYLMGESDTVGTVPIRWTRQWSQRPHIARVDWYRDRLDEYIPTTARTMIEDVFHTAAQSHPDDFRLALYHPLGSIKRSGHSDGRDGAPKYDMTFE